MSYVDEVIELVVKKNPAEPEFHQAVKEVLESLRVVIEANEEKFRKEALLERLVEPERQIKFRVPWVDDNGQVQVNTLSNSLILSRFSRTLLHDFRSAEVKVDLISILRENLTEK